MKNVIWLMLAIVFCLAAPTMALAQEKPVSTVQESQAIVQAVLFYSPTCPHCHQVINQDLPPLNEQYGERLQILGVDISKPLGQELYQNAIEYYGISEARQGVPAMVIGETVLVGSIEIPQTFPQLVAQGMAAGGIGWPDVPGLREAVPDLPPSAAPQNPGEEAAETAVSPTDPTAEESGAESSASSLGVSLEEIDTTTMAAEIAPPPDPVGFTLAWLVMAGMWLALAFTAWRLWTGRVVIANMPETAVAPVNNMLVPFLVILGLIVSVYLSFVEITHVDAVCGPVGECNIVQSSPYAQILGIPIAVLGIINYLAVGGLWLWQRANVQSRRPTLLMLVLTIFGTLFSIYLTTLELFAIEAVCLWCLSSAVVTTFLMVVVAKAIKKQQFSSPLELAS